MIFSDIVSLYEQFLGLFPSFLHPIIAILIVIFLVYSIVQVLRKNLIFLVLLVVLLPASVSVLKQVWDITYQLIKYLLGHS